MDLKRRIAYFSMEIGLTASIPTYSGGLGVLAGDTIRSAADLRLPMIAVTLLHRKGYFRQTLTEAGRQRESQVEWTPESLLTALNVETYVTIGGRRVALTAWRYDVQGIDGYAVPVFFLDADLSANDPQDRQLTDHLYGGDSRYRLSQEIILGIGGVRLLEALGYRAIEHYHMNEGHSSLLTFELMRRRLSDLGKPDLDDDDVENLRSQCVFTTHTPVPAGHDQFPIDLAQQVIGKHPLWKHEHLVEFEGDLNLTYVALSFSRFVNGVAQRHGEVSRRMFSGYEVDAITNGVHAPTWTAPSFRTLFDRYIPGWMSDNFSLRYALSIPLAAIWTAHQEAKQALLDRVKAITGVQMDPDALTLGFARRATPYKRSALLLTDPAQLRAIVKKHGSLQIIYGGKAHPKDEGGKAMIERIHRAMKSLQPEIACVYLPDYDMDLGALMTAGSDVWVNTPEPPMEASGTSGMKSALNGVPSLSVLDGWWIEGCIDGITGWPIGIDHAGKERPHHAEEDAKSLYERLDRDVFPTYYNNRDRFIEIMRHVISLNGSFFNTQRMLQQYARKAYGL